MIEVGGGEVITSAMGGDAVTCVGGASSHRALQNLTRRGIRSKCG